MRRRGKKYTAAKAKVPEKACTLEEAIPLLKTIRFAKFEETMEVALLLGVFGTILYATMRQNLAVEMDRRLQVRASQVELSIWPGTRSYTEYVPMLPPFCPRSVTSLSKVISSFT